MENLIHALVVALEVTLHLIQLQVKSELQKL
jgi:hypothetical protein